MRFLANENFPNPAIQLLRKNGSYVISISEEFAGITDNEVIKIANNENLIILTFDKDYGELIFRHGIVNPPAVIFFRYKGTSPSYAGDFLLTLLNEKAIDFLDIFTVIEKNNIRQRKYS